MRAPALLVVLWSTAATAQVTFADDYEGPLFQADGGVWFSQRVMRGTIGQAAEAAHSGALGLRVDLSVPGPSGTGPQADLLRILAGQPAQYFRTWVRGQAFDAGFSDIGVLSGNPGPVYTIFEARWSPEGWDFVVFDRNLTAYTVSVPRDGGFAPGGWHLLEMMMSGVGTPAARAQAWLDARPVVSSSVDLTGITLDGLSTGASFGMNTFSAIVDFDGFRAAAGPLPSHLALEGPNLISADVCTQLVVSVRNSADGGAAPVTEPTTISLASVAPFVGRTSSDPQCTQPLTDVTLMPGESQRVFWSRPCHDRSMDITATSSDLLPAQLTVLVLAGLSLSCAAGDAGSATDGGGGGDGGPSPGDGGTASARALAVGCGCDATSTTPLFLLALLGCLTRRRLHPYKPRHLRVPYRHQWGSRWNSGTVAPL